jgi:hypothetical protein
MTTMQEITKPVAPTGPAAAALIAAGVGCFMIGLFTTIAEYNTTVKDGLNWYKPTGPLTGKVGVGVIAWLIAWAILHFALKDKNPKIQTVAIWAFTLIALGFALTFPPIFGFFVQE